MNKNEVLAKLTYEHCKKLNKTGYGHNAMVSVRVYVDHVFSDNNSRFRYSDFSSLEKEYLKSGVIKFRYELSQGLIVDEPEEEEVVEAPQPVPAAGVGHAAVIYHEPQEMVHFAEHANNLINANYAGHALFVDAEIQNEQ